MIAKQFIESDSEWLLSVDSDMGFAPDSLDRLLEVADPVKRPIVGGLCFASRETGQDGLGGYRTVPRPTVLVYTDQNGKRGFRGVSYFPVNRVMQCDATGMAFVLIHRSVFERISTEYDGKFYDRIEAPDGFLGEDVSFCVRAGALGFPVHVHTGVRTNHHKPQWVSDWQFWQGYVSPPATEATAVIVPVMKRPQNAAPFMASLRASTGLATVYAVADKGDHETRAAWLAAGATVLDAKGSHFAEKVNEGARRTSEPWVFVVGDDVRFHPGWLDHAQYVGNTEGVAVVGTNDGANPRVLTGEHATHLLIRRSYIDEVGASLDGPGLVCHEGYRHWYVDDEIVSAAKLRGQWGMSLAAMVEHHHPIWGTAPEDDVYKLGQLGAEADSKLFEDRMRRKLPRAS
jgi:glycosyltransferase involved in cell wall biosynthesis